jgi:hypothetical protein
LPQTPTNGHFFGNKKSENKLLTKKRGYRATKPDRNLEILTNYLDKQCKVSPLIQEYKKKMAEYLLNRPGMKRLKGIALTDL